MVSSGRKGSAISRLGFLLPVVQSAVHAKISTLYGRSYGRTSKFFRLDGLLKFFIIMGLRCYATEPKNNRVHTLEQQRNRSSACF